MNKEHELQLNAIYQKYLNITKDSDNIGEVKGFFIYFEGSTGAKSDFIGAVNFERLLTFIAQNEDNMLEEKAQ